MGKGRERTMQVNVAALLPKAEVHVHVEGTFEDRLALEIAKRNRIELEEGVLRRGRARFLYKNLPDFLGLYNKKSKVLRYQEDFHDLTGAYLKKAHRQKVEHAEMFFDPQTHMERGVRFEDVIEGIRTACASAAKNLGMSTKLIMCFQKDRSLASALAALHEAISYKDAIAGVGLDSADTVPPSKFREIYRLAGKNGFLKVAHAGEESGPEYIWQAINDLHVVRVDHGNSSLQDPRLVSELVRRGIPLTVCPLSNVSLRIVNSMEEHPLKRMMELGLMVTVNSDDPAYFGGYINKNYGEVQKALGLSLEDTGTLVKNSFWASFLSISEKMKKVAEVNEKLKRIRGTGGHGGT